MATRRQENDEDTRIQVVPLTEARAERLAEAALALKPEERIEVASYFDQRVQHAAKIWAAAQADYEVLITVPFPQGQSKISIGEINEFGTVIEYARDAQGRYAKDQAARMAEHELSQMEGKLRAEQKILLAACDQLFWDDPKGQRQVSAIRQGTGPADMVQDVSDIIVLVEPHEEFFKDCPKGEWEIIVRWRELAPRLNQLLGQKELDRANPVSRDSRNAAFSLLVSRERRLRRAGGYYFAGTARAEMYGGFEPPKKPKPKEE